MIGGQVSLTPIVENYPGFEKIPGKRLMDIIANQTKIYTQIYEGEQVEELKVGKRIEVITQKGRYLGNAVILTTGGVYRKLDAPGEKRFAGRGVSYCATCDGYFYKGKDILVVGGGNSALTDALYLDSLGCKVTVIHRRDIFRAEKRLQTSLRNREIAIIWDSVVEEIHGDETVKAVRVRNTKSEEAEEMEVEGVFIAIGEKPNSELAQDIGIKVDDSGFIIVDRNQRTNIPRIYAAGDVTGGIRQIVTAIGEGATAALSAYEDLAQPYWKTL